MQRLVGVRTAILVLALVGTVAYLAAAATTYSDPYGRFTFTVPDGYTQRYRAGTDVSFRSAATQTSSFDVAVVAQAPDPLPDVETVAANALKGLTPPAYLPGPTGVKPAPLGGQSARRFDYYTVLDGIPTRLHTLQFVAVTSKAAYVLVFSANEGDYDRMVSDTAIVLGSFMFPGSGAAGSVTTGSSASSVASPTNTRSSVSPLLPSPPATPPGNVTTSGATTTPDLSPPPITMPTVGAAPVFMISTPTPVIPPAAGRAAGVNGMTITAPQQPRDRD